jgi:hypothetical protein
MIGLPVVVVKLVTLLLSLTVAYLAFHAYRRSDVAPLRDVSVGFVFIGVGAVCEGLIYSVLDTSLRSAALVQAGLVSIGMVLVLRSIVAGADRGTVGE